MKQTYNLALFGAGTIAKKIVEVTNGIERFCLYAVASRNVENARNFAVKYGIKHVFESYEDMISDKQVDLVYISTPTRFHYEHIKMCLLAGKNVICEKPFVETAEQATELKQLAESQNLLLMDALWTMYMPIMDNLVEKTKELGKIKYSTASLGYPSVLKSNSGKTEYRYDLWDYAVYPLATTLLLRGEPQELKSCSKQMEGVTVKNRSILKYKDGKARLFSSLLHRSTYMLMLVGTKGMILARKWWFGKFPVIVWKYPLEFTILKFQHEMNGYEYELNEALYCMDKEIIETEKYPLSNAISVLKWAEKMEISECRK